jgi:GTP cyclohydrolase FolE2
MLECVESSIMIELESARLGVQLSRLFETIGLDPESLEELIEIIEESLNGADCTERGIVKYRGGIGGLLAGCF